MISNTSPIIFLAKIKNLDLLKNLYKKVTITTDIKNELLVEDKPDKVQITDAINKGILSVKDPSKLLALGLGKGENSAISLAAELNDSLIIDDSFATKVAKSLGINTLRTTTAIFSAVKKKIITKSQALGMINSIIEEGYYISPRYYKDIMENLK